MTFDPESFKHNRERVVTLDDGNEVIVRRPPRDIAISILRLIGHRLDPQTLKALEAYKQQGDDVAAHITDAEFLQANYQDVWRTMLAFIAFSPTEPRFVLDEADEVDGPELAIWVERLNADDVVKLLTVILEFLGLTLPEVAVIAPFPESGGPEPAGGDVGDQQAEPAA